MSKVLADDGDKGHRNEWQKMKKKDILIALPTPGAASFAAPSFRQSPICHPKNISSKGTGRQLSIKYFFSPIAAIRCVVRIKGSNRERVFHFSPSPTAYSL